MRSLALALLTVSSLAHARDCEGLLLKQALSDAPVNVNVADSGGAEVQILYRPRVVNQCGGTCFFESAAGVLEQHAKATQSANTLIDRAELLAHHTKSRLSAILDQAESIGSTLSRKRNPDFSEYGVFDDGGQYGDVIDLIELNGIRGIKNPTPAQVRAGQKRVEKFSRDIDKAYAKYIENVAAFYSADDSRKVTQKSLSELRNEATTSFMEIIYGIFNDRSGGKSLPIHVRLGTIPAIKRNMPPETLLASVREEIDQGHPVLINYYQSREKVQHAAIIIGYLLNRNGEVKQFILQQSWGSGYRNKGTETYPIAKLAREIEEGVVIVPNN